MDQAIARDSDQTPLFIKVSTAAKLADCCAKTIIRSIRRGDLQSKLVNKRHLIDYRSFTEHFGTSK
jgi:hypothetical protein